VKILSLTGIIVGLATPFTVYVTLDDATAPLVSVSVNVTTSPVPGVTK